MNAILGFIQEYRSEKALEELKRYISMRTHVMRGGQVTEINVQEIVPGDIILIAIGDIIPADGKIIETHEFEVNESTITGESEPVTKKPGENVLMSSVVISGSAKAIVTATGKHTSFGTTAGQLEIGRAHV